MRAQFIGTGWNELHEIVTEGIKHWLKKNYCDHQEETICIQINNFLKYFSL